MTVAQVKFVVAMLDETEQTVIGGLDGPFASVEEALRCSGDPSSPVGIVRSNGLTEDLLYRWDRPRSEWVSVRAFSKRGTPTPRPDTIPFDNPHQPPPHRKKFAERFSVEAITSGHLEVRNGTLYLLHGGMQFRVGPYESQFLIEMLRQWQRDNLPPF